jgi:anthranilate phosphoribosyltransferase
VLLNAAACLWVGDKVHDMGSALTHAAACLDAGEPRKTLDRLVAISHS